MKKRSKSLPSVLLAAALFSTLPYASLAQAADAVTTATVISMDDAVNKAREVANLPEANWKLVSTDQRSGKEMYDSFNRPTWVLQFSSTEKNTYVGASVTIDSTNGQLLSMNRYEKGGPTKPGTLSRDDAKKVVETFLQKNAPDQLKQSVLDDSHITVVRGPYDGYNFRYERQVNGVYVLGDQINISIGTDGTLENYLLQWTDAQFPALDGKIDADTVQKTYADSLKMRLTYQDDYQGQLSEKLLYKSTYSPINQMMKGPEPQPPVSYPIIDAKSGKFLTPAGTEATSITTPDPIPLVQGGPTEPTTLPTAMKQEDAEKWVTSLGLFPENVTLVQSTYSENTSKIWNFVYQDPNDSNQRFNISVNAQTGELNNYGAWSDKAPTSGTVNYTDEQLQNRAVDLLKKIFKDRTGALLLPTSLSPSYGGPYSDTSRDFTFGLLKNGVVTNNGIHITLDASTGRVLNIMAMMTYPEQNNVTYPTPDNLISVDKAKAVYLQNRPLRLSYLFPTTDKGRSNTPVLVYTPNLGWNNSIGVDAKTGEWFNPDPYQPQKAPVMPTDIKGHWAEKSLTHFAEIGLLELVDGKANPDQKLTRAQAVRLIIDARNGGGYFGNTNQTFTDVPKDFKYYAQIETAVSQGWIAQDTKFRPNDTITREEAAAIFARLEGFKNLSTHKEIFQVHYADSGSISDWAYGSVAINYGLGVMKGSNNMFDPKANFTLAQMVTMLDKLASLPSANVPIYYK